MRLTVGQRLALSFSLIAIAMVFVTVFGLYNLSRLNANTGEILYEHRPVLDNIAAIKSGVLFHSLKVEQYVTTGNRAHLRTVGELRDGVEANLADLESRTLEPQDQQLVQEIRDAYNTYISMSDGMRDFYNDNPNDAPDVEGRQMRIAALLENSLLAKSDALYEAKQIKIQELIQANSKLYTNYLWITVASSLVLIVLPIALSIFVSRSIVVPIRQLTAVTEKIAGGDLTVVAPVRAGDEIGLLASAFNSTSARLRDMVEGLEQRVAERTHALQAAADVSRATTSVLDPDQLLRHVVTLVRERFALYYVGLFLLDEKREFAVLRAGTGEAGREMLVQGHRLKVGGESMIGQCVTMAEALIASDVGAEAVHFDNPFLPDTRSELALPLRSRGTVIGAMTVQSVKEAAFDEEYIVALQTMADQVAVAIDNARLFAETKAALDDLEVTHQRYLGRVWTEYSALSPINGYEQVGAEIRPLSDDVLPAVQRAMADRRTLVVSGDGDAGEATDEPALIVPVVLRGQPVGVLGFKRKEKGWLWSKDEIALAEALADQLALAADNLRLLEETQRRAARERLAGEITARVRETLDVDTVLQTAVREIGEKLALSELVIRVGAGAGDRIDLNRGN